MATLPRRALLAAAPAALLAACEPKMPVTASTTPTLDIERMRNETARIAAAARPGVLGVGLMNLESGQTFDFNGELGFPMQGVFKMVAAAAALAEVDLGRLTLGERIVIAEDQLSPPWSPIAAAWPARRDYSARDLIEATLVDGDNTAADVLMKRIGGPGAVMAWLIERRVPGVRVDRYAREIQPECFGMASFRPAWRTREAFDAARAAVPAPQRLAAMRACLADPRDTATPQGMLEFLSKLDRQELISPASSLLLVQILGRTRRRGGISAGLPRDSYLAHRPGLAGTDLGQTAVHNDVGVFTLADKRAYALAVFLAGSTLDRAGRDRVLAEVAAAAVRAVG
jgi:beta-lactamase class A